MSKGLGKKIVVKFTQDLNPVVRDIVSVGDYFSPVGTPSTSSQYSYFGADRVFDGDTSSYWYTRTTGNQWVQIALSEPKNTTGFRFYVGSSYRLKDFIAEGSNDGTTWATLTTGQCPNATGWNEFTWDAVTYSYYRWTITSRWGSYLFVYEIELLGTVMKSGQEETFTVTGKRETYQGSGVFIDETYLVSGVESHPTLDSKHLLLNVEKYPTIKNSVGLVTVAYDQSKGSLAGIDGLVTSFIETFTPIDLDRIVNPNPKERITLGINATAIRKAITYHQRYAKETITLGVNCTVTRTYVEIVNP